jgi:dihydroorotate dehydrogenase (NAD+) catalytic subunit
MNDQRLATTLCGIPLPNPVIAASGTFGYGIEFENILDLNALGGLVTKGLSREPIAGNPPPRLWHTDAGMMNSVGLQNVGVRAFVLGKLSKLRRYTVPVIANVFGFSADDYVEVVRVLEDADRLSAYELNVSCPNTKHGGMFFSSDPSLLADLIARVRTVARRPLIVKLSPNVADIKPLAVAAQEAGADALSLINTFVSLALDVNSRRPRIGAGFAGLSGPAIKPLALRLVYEAACTVSLPVIGLGGILSGEDAAEFLIAGAAAVQVGTATFINPRAPVLISRELGKIAERLKVTNIRQLVGSVDSSAFARLVGRQMQPCKIEQ